MYGTVLVDLSPLGPQTLALVAMRCPAADLARTMDEVNRHVRVRSEVEPPRRFGVAPTVHGHGDQVRALFEVANDHSSGSARPPADRVKAHGAPTAGLRSPQTESGTGPAVQAPMSDSEESDEPAGRKSCLRVLQLRDVSDLQSAFGWRVISDGGHGNLPRGGHRMSPLIATRFPHRRPRISPLLVC